MARADSPTVRISIEPIAEQTARELMDVVELDERAREEAMVAFAEYRVTADRCRTEAQQAVHEADGGRMDALRRELHGEVNLIGPSNRAPLDDPRWGDWRVLQAAVRNAAQPFVNEHRDAMRALIESLERICAEHGRVHPRPRWFILSRFERASSRNPLDPRIVDLNVHVMASLDHGVLAELHDRLRRAMPHTEADQFEVEVRMTLLDYSIAEEDRLTRRYLRHRPEYAADDPSLGPRPIDDDTHAMLAKNGERWRERFAARQHFVERIGAVVEDFGRADDADRWRAEYRAAVCAPIYELRWPERVVSWLHDQPEATPEEIAMAQALREQYDAAARPIRERAYQVALVAAGTTGFATIVFRDSPEHEMFHDALLDLHMLGREMLVTFRRSLSLRLRERVKEIWLVESRRIAGPIPEARFLDDTAVARLIDWPDMPREWGW